MTTANEHFENAASEYERKIEEGFTEDKAYIVALDYLEDLSQSWWGYVAMVYGSAFKY